MTEIHPFQPALHPHRRRNLLTGEWVLVSPHRTKRPWQGQVEKSQPQMRPVHDPTCYLCPGNERAAGRRNPEYTQTFVFENDFAALLPEGPVRDVSSGPLFQAQAETGLCRVICFSPRHDLTLPEMAVPDIRKVVEVWAEQISDLGRDPRLRYIQLFENKGALMGASNPHPHGQVWASHRVPNQPAIEDELQRAYYAEHGSPLLVDYLQAEAAAAERTVVENRHWVALVPYWAIWPFEILLLPRRHLFHVPDLEPDERDDLADILRRLLTRYDNLFETSFPYSMGWHGRPMMADVGGDELFCHWQLHAHFYPPLLRSATVRKFMVGYEMLAMPQRDITAEQAAERLRDAGEIHYRVARAG